MMQDRRQLRNLLRALIAERGDAQLLYIPHGEAGQRRMIAALLPLRTPNENDAQLSALLDILEPPIRL